MEPSGDADRYDPMRNHGRDRAVGAVGTGVRGPMAADARQRPHLSGTSVSYQLAMPGGLVADLTQWACSPILGNSVSVKRSTGRRALGQSMD